MQELLQDLRFARRLLWKDRTVAMTAALTLGVCVGANITIFTLVNSVLLKPLPVPHAAQLVFMYNAYPGAGAEAEGFTSVPDYDDRLSQTDVFQAQALYHSADITVGVNADPQRIAAMLATPSLLRMLQVQPVRGRIFSEQEGTVGHTHNAVLTYAAWEQWFGGDDSAIGRDIRINDQPYTVIGVLPKQFAFLDPDVMVWLPLAFTAAQRSDAQRHHNNWSYLARLKSGATIEQARQEIDALNARNLDRFPALKQVLINARFRTVVDVLQAHLVRDVRNTLLILWAGVAFVLLIGAVNVTNLMLVRSSARVKELATRHALGAPLGRIARQLLTEAALLSAAGGLAGLGLGYAGLRALTRLGLDRTPAGMRVAIDSTVLAFTIALSAALAIVIGLIPVISLRRLNLNRAFREDGRSATAGRGARTLRRTLVALQVAFALMLLIGAGGLLTSFQRVLAVKPGFNPSHVLTGVVSPPQSRYRDDASLRMFWNRFLDGVRALPGVESAALVSNLPMGGSYGTSVILAEGHVMAPGESLISPYFVRISPDYFKTMAIPLKRGRVFTPADDENAPGVVIIDERLAEHFWKGNDPVGRRMWTVGSPEELAKGPGPKSHFYTVVGVVDDVRVTGLTEKEPAGMYYLPIAQDMPGAMTLVTRTGGDPLQLTGAIRRALASIDPGLPFFSVRPMQQRIDQTLIGRRLPMLIASVFGGIALFLAAVGVYGVLAYQVVQRRKELGIRMALGCDGGRIFGLVISEGLWLLGLGAACGMAGAFAIRTALQSLLFGMSAMDPFVLASVIGVLALVAVAACAIPAARAARIDPLVALNDASGN